MDNKPLWSCVTYNFNNYELFYELPESVINDNAEYLYFSNDKTLTSSTWTIVYMECDDDPFNTVCELRYHIFDYIRSDIAVLFDGSMRPLADLEPIVEEFNKGNYDFASIIHPSRNTMYDELYAWVQQRGMPVGNANYALQLMASNNYDVRNYKGLFQINLMVMRRTDIVFSMQENTMKVCRILAEEGKKSFRCDQVVVSFIINRYLPMMKVMPIGQYVCGGVFFNWYVHGTDNRMLCDDRNNIEPFLFNRSVSFPYLWPKSTEE